MKIQLTWLHSIFALIFVALPLQTQGALFVIDSFSQEQYVIASNGNTVSNGPLALDATSTDLINARRTLISQSGAGVGAFQDILIEDGMLDISNSSTSVRIASVLWNGFDAVDFLALGINAFLLDVAAIDHDADFEIVVNGTWFSPLQNVAGPGQHFVNFGNTAAFSNVTSLRLNLSGPAAWDGQIRMFGAQHQSTVPEPSKFLLLSFTLIAFGFVKKSRSGS